MSKKLKANVPALPRTTVTAINSAVRAYANAEGKFNMSIVALAKANPNTTEAQWNALYQPAFKAAFDRHTVGSASVMLGRVKSLFLGASRDVLPTNDAGEPITALSQKADEERRKALIDAKVLTRTNKGAKPSKGKASPKAANEAGKASDPVKLEMVKPGTMFTAEQRRGGLIAGGLPHKLASELAALLNNSDVMELWVKNARAFVSANK